MSMSKYFLFMVKKKMEYFTKSTALEDKVAVLLAPVSVCLRKEFKEWWMNGALGWLCLREPGCRRTCFFLDLFCVVWVYQVVNQSLAYITPMTSSPLVYLLLGVCFRFFFSEFPAKKQLQDIKVHQCTGEKSLHMRTFCCESCSLCGSNK